MSWTGVAIGGATLVSGYLGSQAAGDAADASSAAARYSADLQQKQYEQSREDLTPYREAGYSNLGKLDRYGRSQVDPNQYIPGSQIPQYQRSQINMNPNIQGNIPEFDSTQFDIYKDPSYDWRVEEQMRGIDRTAGATGKVTSGNRLEELMSRSGEMASQEYGAARQRMVQDYDIRRQNEQSQYGRDVGDYQRGYAQNVDQYGRDLTAYNADVAREASLYGRGVNDYGRAYQQEGDYLNRLAALSNIGQSATNTGVTAGASAAYNQGSAIQAAGNAQAAGTIGQANAYTGTIGDMASLYAMSKYGGGGYQPPSVTTNYNPVNTPYMPAVY